MGYSHGTHWSEQKIYNELDVFIKQFGRMPSANELSKLHRNDLACIISRHGGYAYWAERFATTLKGTETHRGHHIENCIASFLKTEGFLVQQMPTKHPYDLLLNNRITVDVKSSQYNVYGKNDRVKGFFFGINKKIPTCDFYILCCVDANNHIMSKYIVPSSKAKVKMITITPKGKYTRYIENIALLHDAAKE